MQIFGEAGLVAELRSRTAPIEVPGEAWVDVTTCAAFFGARLGFDPADGVSLAQWLAAPTQRLGTMVAGVVMHDPDGALAGRRATLAWYPRDIWRYTLAAAWLRVDQHAPFLGRTGSRGDDLGSRLIAARLVRDLMRLAFLVERRWAPYDKWFGTAFARLQLAAQLTPSLDSALGATGWRDREEAFLDAAAAVLRATNALGLAPAVDPSPRQFWNRDLRVVAAMDVARGLIGAIVDPEVRALAANLTRDVGASGLTPSIPGSIDQLSDNVEILEHPDRCLLAWPSISGGASQA